VEEGTEPRPWRVIATGLCCLRIMMMMMMMMNACG